MHDQGWNFSGVASRHCKQWLSFITSRTSATASSRNNVKKKNDCLWTQNSLRKTNRCFSAENRRDQWSGNDLR